MSWPWLKLVARGYATRAKARMPKNIRMERRSRSVPEALPKRGEEQLTEREPLLPTRGKLSLPQLTLALKTYEGIRTAGRTPSVQHIAAALKACSKYRDLETGLKIHAEAGVARDPGCVIANRLIEMYAKCGDMSEALKLFDKLRKKKLFAWKAMIMGYVRHGMHELAVEYFHKLKESGVCCPDGRSYVLVFKACAALASKEHRESGSSSWLVKVRELHSELLPVQMDVHLASALVQAYAHSGSLEDARKVFDGVSEEQKPALWNALVRGYAENGRADEVRGLYERAQQGDGVLCDI